jgi:hypothetical protein
MAVVRILSLSLVAIAFPPVGLITDLEGTGQGALCGGRPYVRVSIPNGGGGVLHVELVADGSCWTVRSRSRTKLGNKSSKRRSPSRFEAAQLMRRHRDMIEPTAQLGASFSTALFDLTNTTVWLGSARRRGWKGRARRRVSKPIALPSSRAGRRLLPKAAHEPLRRYPPSMASWPKAHARGPQSRLSWEYEAS